MNVGDGERKFISECSSFGIRLDGRKNFDFRRVHAQNDVVSQATGSSHVQLGKTDIFVGIKVEIGEPTLTYPDCGRIEFFVEYAPCGTQDLEEEEAETIGHQLADALAQIWKIHHTTKKCGGLDMSSLCIIEGKSCFVIYVDMTVLNVDGNVLGAISIGILTAIHQLPVPHVEISMQQEGEIPEIEIDEDKCTHLDTSHCPIIITIGYIGDRLMVDMSSAEEATSKLSLHVGVDREGMIHGLSSSFKSPLQPHQLEEMMQLAKRTGIEVHKSMTAFLQDEMDVQTE